MPSHEKRMFRRNKSLRYSLFDNPHVPKVRSGVSHNLCLDLGALLKHLTPSCQRSLRYSLFDNPYVC